MVEPNKTKSGLNVLKEYWEYLVVIGAILTVSFTFWDKITEIYEMPTEMAALNERINRLENRVRKECKHVGLYHQKDYNSLRKMAKQRQQELRARRDKYFDMGKNSDKDPVFVTLAVMESEWKNIMDFLEEEQQWYNAATLKCLENGGFNTSAGDSQ